jgi:hypothetical protein
MTDKRYDGPLTPRVASSGSGPRVIIEDPDRYPFAPSERERDWREATDAEYQAYLDYRNQVHDAIDE